jgi:NAD(P)-dependent dehydrogenase (short-subunit alcohol dehydrogenase family)
MQPLRGRVAVVAGATRGAGRGIATALGEAGAIVYCSGRSTRAAGATPGRPETIEETAEIVTRVGGTGIAQRTDHTHEAEVETLFARVRAEHGRLDILVNDVWGGDELTEFGKSFWELTTPKGFTMLDRAVRAHILTSRHGAPLMIERNSGLIVEVTDGDKIGYRGNLFYDLAKTTAIRLAFAMAHDLDGRPITALAVTPGFLRSEAMLDRFEVTEANWRDAVAQDPFFAESETPLYVGRAVAALAADPNVHAKRGKAWASWTLMREYGFTDADGRQPDWSAFFTGTIRELVARGGPYTEFERFLLRARALEIEFEHGLAAEHAQLLAVAAS